MTEEERKRMAQTSTLGSNLQLGGFGNPMGFTQPQRFSLQPSAERAMTSISNQPVPAFPPNISQPIATQPMDLTRSPMRGAPTDYISSTPSAGLEGRTPIQTPYGTVTATPEQRTTALGLAQGAQPTFEQRLAQMKERGSAIRERIATTARDSFENRTPSRLYTTPAGAAIAAPTNMYGQPIADFQQRYAQREERITGQRALSTLGGPQPAATLATSTLGSNLGIGGFQNPSLYNPAQTQQSLVTNNTMRSTRRRRTLSGA
jgi:hypothetical protein